MVEYMNMTPFEHPAITAEAVDNIKKATSAYEALHTDFKREHMEAHDGNSPVQRDGIKADSWDKFP